MFGAKDPISAANAIVTSFSTTFFWPLTIDLPSGAACGSDHVEDRLVSDCDMRAIVDHQLGKLSRTPWTLVTDGLKHLHEMPPQQDEQASTHAHIAAYAEYTYFHDYIQRHYFVERGQEKSSLVNLYRRDDIKNLTVTLLDPKQTGCSQSEGNTTTVFDLSVKRLSLYVYGAGLAALIVEVQGEGNFVSHDSNECSRAGTLADVMSFNDRMRRSHAPFIDPKGESHFSQVPYEVVWKGNDTQSYTCNDDLKGLPESLLDKNGEEREIQPFAHWTTLLSEWDIAPAESKGISWRHVCDERLPIMSTIALNSVSDYRKLREGDWMRLCFVDQPGIDPFPYQSAFLNSSFGEHVYDRYHFEDEKDSTDMPVRFLFTGYSMIAVGTAFERNNRPSFFSEHITTHMRRHYFHMMLFVQVEYALMLAFSSRISLAVADLDRGSRKNRFEAEEAFDTAMRWIERDFMQFLHKHRLTGVSNQLQAAEIYQLMRKHKSLDSLFADLEKELSLAMSFLHRRAEQARALAAERLNHIATFGVVIGLALSVLSIPDLTGHAILGPFKLSGEKGSLWNAGLVGLTIGTFAALGLGAAKVFQIEGSRLKRWTFLHILLGFVAVSGIGSGVWTLMQQTGPTPELLAPVGQSVPPPGQVK